MPFVYILRCNDGSLYTGSARDLEARVSLHQAGRGARYTRTRLPVALAWSCEVPSWSEALREEYRIKRLRREAKDRLIASN